MPDFDIVIPARLASTRLPRKPLANLGGKPLVVRVVEQASRTLAQHVWVACDHDEIVKICGDHGVEAHLTSPAHHNGTERLYELLQRMKTPDERIVVNMQGDEPFVEPSVIHHLVQKLEESRADMSTVATPIRHASELLEPSIVKVVCNAHHDALYFSRSAIPWTQDQHSEGCLRHIGLYAYRAGFIKRYLQWPVSPLEQAESLEQLRTLWYGGRIHVHQIVDAPLPGIDTPEDLIRANQHFAQMYGRQKEPLRQ